MMYQFELGELGEVGVELGDPLDGFGLDQIQEVVTEPSAHCGDRLESYMAAKRRPGE